MHITYLPLVTVAIYRTSFTHWGTVLFRISREACPIYLGPKILSRLTFMNLVFCLFKFTFLGSQLAENLYFWINLAYNKEELNEKILRMFEDGSV